VKSSNTCPFNLEYLGELIFENKLKFESLEAIIQVMNETDFDLKNESINKDIVFLNNITSSIAKLEFLESEVLLKKLRDRKF